MKKMEWIVEVRQSRYRLGNGEKVISALPNERNCHVRKKDLRREAESGENQSKTSFC